MSLDAPVVEVDERDDGERPVDLQRTRGRLRAGNQADEVRDEDEEEQGCKQRDVLLVTVTDGALTDVVTHHLIAVFDHVDKFVVRNERQTLARQHDNCEHDDPYENGIQHVLRDAETRVTERDDKARIERFLQFGHQGA